MNRACSVEAMIRYNVRIRIRFGVRASLWNFGVFSG